MKSQGQLGLKKPRLATSGPPALRQVDRPWPRATATDKRTRTQHHGITRARSDRRNPYHSGGADGGDGQLLVVGVVPREQICRSPQQTKQIREGGDGGKRWWLRWGTLGLLADVGEEAGSLHGHGGVCGGGGLGMGTGEGGRLPPKTRKRRGGPRQGYIARLWGATNEKMTSTEMAGSFGSAMWIHLPTV
jgi:hypothetical protein